MISVITPSYNQGQYIERTIQSVLNQAIPELEYLVVDGGSTDETLSIIKKYTPQIRYVSEKDNGQADAVNKGICLTSHPIIGWLNSDDIYYPSAIQTILDFFEKNPSVDVVFGRANHIDQNDQFIEEYPTEAWNLDRFKETCFLSQPAVFFRRRVVEQYGALNADLNFCLDYEFWLRLALRGVSFCFLPLVLAGSRLYPETKTMSFPARAQREAIHMIKSHLSYVPDAWIIKDAIAVVKNNTSYQMPSYRYIVSVALTAAVLSFKWNGFAAGIRSCWRLPMQLIQRKQKK